MVCPISQHSAVSLSGSNEPGFVLGGTFSVTFGLRSYSPELGRWVNRDPIGEMGGFNLFNFLSNQLLNTYDYLGLISPEDIGPFLDKLLQCKKKHPDIANWDAGIEYLMLKAYGKKWRKFLVNVSKGVQTNLGIVKFVPEKTDKARDILEKMYPDGIPFTINGILDADLDKLVNELTIADAALGTISVIVEGSEDDLTSAQTAEVFSKVFGLSKTLSGLAPSVPGVGSFLDFYGKAIEGVSAAIGDLQDIYFKKESDFIILTPCKCIPKERGFFRGIVKEMLDKMELK